MILNLGTINVPRKVGAKAWRECFERTAQRAELFGINEVFSLRQKRTFHRCAVEHGLRQYGLLKGPNPIVNDPREWRRVRASQYQLHGNGPWFRRWSGYNAARFATVALYRSTRVEGPLLAVINTHWVPRGRKVPAWWRARARKRAIAVISGRIRRHLDAGHVVVVMGDLNMDKAPDLPRVVWVHDKGVDKIGVACPEGWEISGAGAYRYPAPTDHRHGAAASVWLARTEN